MHAEETPKGEASAEAPGTTRPRDSDGWSWKPEERERLEELGLLYEPGNWGDILKGTWTLLVVEELAKGRAPDDPPLRYLDPWAGARFYPLLDPVRHRIEDLGPTIWTRAQAPWVARGHLASTASLVLDAFERAKHPVSARVFDVSATRRDTWRAGEESGDSGDRPLRARIEIAQDESGEGVLAAGGAASDLVLVDPYDFFDAGSHLLPAVLSFAGRTATLLYLYNKATRGGARVRQYRALRERLDRSGVDWVAGRVPSDAVLPRAFHEMWLLGPKDLLARVAPILKRATQRLACKLATGGAFESGRREDRL